MPKNNNFQNISSYAKEELYEVLENIRVSAMSVPITEALPESECNQIEGLITYLWLLYIPSIFKDAIHKSSEELPFDKQQLINLKKAQHYIQESMTYFECDSLISASSRPLEELKLKAYKVLKKCEHIPVEQKGLLTESNLKKLSIEMHRGFLQLEQFEAAVKAYPKTPAKARKISFIFPAVGGFIGAVCGVLASPLFAAAASIDNLISWISWEFKDGLYPLLSVRGVGSIFATMLFIAVTTPFVVLSRTIEGIIYTTQMAADLAKRTVNQEYKVKTNLLYEIVKLDNYMRGIPNPDRSNSVDRMLRNGYEYFSLLGEIDAAHAKFTGIDDLKQSSPSLTVKLTKYFIGKLRQLEVAIKRAEFGEYFLEFMNKKRKVMDDKKIEISLGEKNEDEKIIEHFKDSNAIIKTLNVMINTLEKNWQSIITPLKEKNMQEAIDAAGKFLELEQKQEVLNPSQNIVNGNNKNFILYDYLEYSTRMKDFLNAEINEMNQQIIEAKGVNPNVNRALSRATTS